MKRARKSSHKSILVGGAALIVFVTSGGSYAQSSIEEVIVTARKREETSLATPVVLTAVGSKELERRQITGVDSLAHIVPNLVIGEGGGSVQGGIISIRGIGSGESNPFIDQAVSFNVDGVAVAQAGIRRLAQMDMQQVEILKGPQALFFGKNSPAGIIAMRTADPTPNFQARFSFGYEPYADEKQLQGSISGPLTDKLGARLAFYADHMDKGWVDNLAPDNGVNPPFYKTLPQSKEYAVRGTLKYEGERFDARFKIAAQSRRGTDSAANVQLIGCPLGAPQGSIAGFPVVNDCTADNRQYHLDPGPSFGKNPLGAGAFGDGIPFLNEQQLLSSIELNYNLTDQLKLTSVSGYYDARLQNVSSFEANNAVQLTLPSHNFYEMRQYSEEFRITSDYSGPLNFMGGVLYNKSLTLNGSVTELNALSANPAVINNYRYVQDGDAWSVFGQVRYSILKTVELSGGARYSHEKKSLPVTLTGTSNSGVQFATTPPVKEASWNNLSPEATISWRPSDTFTAFASYKYGFVSGGFNGGAANGIPTPYTQQQVRGAEAGVKGLFLNGRLRANLAYYDYVTTGLAITTSVNTVLLVQNAGKVKYRGVEFDFEYAVPQVDGLQLRGALSYEHARYAIYGLTCYPGQTIALGCNQAPNASGVFSLQDLAGTPLLRTPDWSGTVGVGYEFLVFNGYKAGIYTDATFSGGYLTEAQSIPGARQPSFTLLDTTASIAGPQDRWEFAVIGRNLTNKYTFVRGNSLPFLGSGTGTATGVLGDYGASVSRGREVWVRLTLKYDQ